MIRRIGRFEILGELGRGAQTVVHLARDPQWQRQVAIKSFDLPAQDAGLRRQFLDEARIISQLRHPNIVPLLEVAEEGGVPRLVFQYIAGENLGEHLDGSGRLAPARAMAVIESMLDALVHAHAAGVLHGNLKPSNVLIDREGMPRLVDFGTADRLRDPGGPPPPPTGSLSYRAPEAVLGGASSERSDIFSVGLILLDLLAGSGTPSGRPLREGIQRSVDEESALSDELRGLLDERLLQILQRSLARDPAERFDSAARMRDAVDDCLARMAESGLAGPPQSTIDLLLRRMRSRSDFPALSEAVSAINRMTSSESQSIAELSQAILRDFSLTHKILRMVNAVCYRQAAGGSISTVSRAVVVLGLDAVRNMAITVLLLDHLQNRGEASELRDEFLRAHLAGVLARELGIRSASRPDAEQLFVCALFHNLGRLLSRYHFPAESAEIQRVAMRKKCSLDIAAAQVLGVSLEDLGIGVARSWGFPKVILDSMRRLPPGSLRRPPCAEERFRCLAALANEVCSVVIDTAVEQQPREWRKAAVRFAEAASFGEADLRMALDRALDEVAQFAANIRLDLRQTHFGRRVERWRGALPPAQPLADAPSADRLELLADAVQASAREEAESRARADCAASGAARSSCSESILLAGIEDVSSALLNGFGINDVLRIALEALYRAMAFRRVILCLRDTRSESMVGRLGFGRDALEIARRFRFSLAPAPDVFHAVLSRGLDVLISDTSDPRIAPRIPDWFARDVAAQTFVALPLCVKGTAVAMIYADRERAGEIVISRAQFSLIRTLRNQALLAIRQSKALCDSLPATDRPPAGRSAGD